MAKEAGLKTADKKDSQGICFIGQVRMEDFLRAYVPDRPGPTSGLRRPGTRPTPGTALLHPWPATRHRCSLQCRKRAVRGGGKRAEGDALLVAFDHPMLRGCSRLRYGSILSAGPASLSAKPAIWRDGSATATLGLPSSLPRGWRDRPNPFRTTLSAHSRRVKT